MINARDVTERLQLREASWRLINHVARAPTTALSTIVEEKLEVEAQLRESEELFRAIVQNSSDAITVIDENGTIRYGSPLGEKVLGYEAGFALGLDALELVHPDDQAMVTEIDGPGRSRSPGSTARSWSVCSTRNGSWRYLEAIGNNLWTTRRCGGGGCRAGT